MKTAVARDRTATGRPHGAAGSRSVRGQTWVSVAEPSSSAVPSEAGIPAAGHSPFCVCGVEATSF